MGNDILNLYPHEKNFIPYSYNRKIIKFLVRHLFYIMFMSKMHEKRILRLIPRKISRFLYLSEKFLIVNRTRRRKEKETN